MREPSGRRARLALVVAAAGTGALACSGDTPASPPPPPAVVGPEALALGLAATPDSVGVGQSVSLRAVAYNRSAHAAVLRYEPGACGLRIVIETAAGGAFASYAVACRTVAGAVASDTVAPGDSLVLAGGFGIDEPGRFRAHAELTAGNGSAPRTSVIPVVVR